MKNLSRCLMLFLVGSLASGCIVMHRVYDVPINQTSFKHFQEIRLKWTIQSDTAEIRNIFIRKLNESTAEFEVRELQTVDDHPRYGVRHPTYWRRFGRFKLDHFHIHVPAGTIKEGPMEVQYSNMLAARTHGVSWTTVPASIITTTVIYGTALFIACNCPRVMVMGPDGWIRQGALFAGAMSKALERSDNLILRNVPRLGENVAIRVANELPETEYIDEVALYELSGLVYPNVGTLNNAPVAYGNVQLPQAALNGNGTEITKLVAERDTSHYDFDEIERYDELNKVYLKFPRNEAGTQPLLLVNANQSPWTETVGEYFFQQFGNKYDKWVDRLDEMDPKNYNQNLVDRGISLNAYVKVDGEWKYKGSFENVGTQAPRTMALPLNTSNLKGDEIDVKLESAYGLWELDYAALTNEWSPDVKGSKLKMVSATDQSGQDVSARISSDDQSYVVQPAKTSFVDLKFEAPSRRDAVLMLRGNGYYHHERDYTHEPNTKLIRELRRDAITTHQMSRTLKAQLAPSLSAGNK